MRNWTKPITVALSGLLLALGAILAMAPGAQAATTTVSEVAEQLRKSPVYVDPAMRGELSSADADALAKKIKDAGKPVFVAVLPADFPAQNGVPEQNLFRNLRTETGITGLYAVRLGDKFGAAADGRVLSKNVVDNLRSAAQGKDTKAQLDGFVDDALASSIRGKAPTAWGGGSGSDGVNTGALIGLGAVAVAGGAGAYALVKRNKRKKAEAERAALEKVAVVVDEDITAFGEELDRLDFHPAEPGADDAMRADYERALDSYEKAKSIMASAERPADVRGVTQAVEDGRFSLAVLAARREGR
ncbi:hypothetical protein P8605_17705, partial [Streptomyces sp. T-3]|nr:hypothetical protein [Streptomyces sp. T-3]